MLALQRKIETRAEVIYRLMSTIPLSDYRAKLVDADGSTGRVLLAEDDDSALYIAWDQCDHERYSEFEIILVVSDIEHAYSFRVADDTASSALSFCVFDALSSFAFELARSGR